jgi:D-lactate dehydrogenase
MTSTPPPSPPLDFISTRWIDRLAYAHDASLYRLVPTAVARPRSVEDVASLLHHCRQHHTHLTFRCGGTSLSGQAVTSGILVDLARHWNAISIEENGRIVRVQPGMTGGRVNALLAPYKKKIGPDPASLNAAMIGGIVANNASGMCCGTQLNSYHTIRSMRFMLADGSRFDSGLEGADDELRERRPDLHLGLSTLRDTVRADVDLQALIRRKYRIKNTVGYSLNAFLDEDEPVKILARLMVGSEGTLGFIEEVVFNTIDDAAEKYAQFFLYDTLEEACTAVPVWTEAGAAAIELMDDASLRSFADLPHTPDNLRINREGATALLVEFHDMRPDGGGWISDARERAALWRLRKGLMPTIGAMRPSGTTMINEDIAVPPGSLADLIRDTKEAFAEFSYINAIIFGHAKDGNIHFVVYQDFAQEGETERYAAFMDRIAHIVVDRYGGSLKAEHGTGRNMAPYVEKEWGNIAYGVMKTIKTLVDPDGILNPDVILSTNTKIHLENIKPIPTIEASVDSCIECGFCEHVCPTRQTTLTPRQRIVIRRELALMHDGDQRAAVLADERWDSVGSCAVDGFCATACPVEIDTGVLVRELRRERKKPLTSWFVSKVSANVQWMDRGARLLTPIVRRLNSAWPRSLGSSGSRSASDYDISHNASSASTSFIYFQGCPSRWFGTPHDGDPWSLVIHRLAQRAGVSLTSMPAGSYCCGQPFSSKGYPDQAALARDHTLQALHSRIPEGGKAFCDVSTCSSVLTDGRSTGSMITPSQLLADVVMPLLTVKQRFHRIILHPGCGAARSHDVDTMVKLLRMVADDVIIPPSSACCGMAGVHGIDHPEIVRTAVGEIDRDLDVLGTADRYVTLNPLCEAGLSEHTSATWTSIWHVVDEATA